MTPPAARSSRTAAVPIAFMGKFLFILVAILGASRCEVFAMVHTGKLLCCRLDATLHLQGAQSEFRVLTLHQPLKEGLDLGQPGVEQVQTGHKLQMHLHHSLTTHHSLPHHAAAHAVHTAHHLIEEIFHESSNQCVELATDVSVLLRNVERDWNQGS